MIPWSSSRAVRAALLLPLAGLAACDLPSEPPIVQQTWVVPTDSVSISVAEVLPAGVALNGAGTAFTVTTPTANINTTLAAVCGQPACQSPVTVVAPVPAFTSPVGALTASIALPAGVSSVTMTGGTLNLGITNNLGFDPLRPNGVGNAPFGTLTITITNGALTSTTTFNGGQQGIANGATTNLQVALPAATYAGSIGIALSLNVPAGGNATMSGANALAVSAALANVAVSQAAVVIANEAINASPSEFDLSGIDFADEVESGAIILEVTNPLTAIATLSLTVSAPSQGGAPAVNIVKAANVGASVIDQQVTLNFTKAELQSLLGKDNVTIAVGGSASGTGAGNIVTVTPTSRIVLRTFMQLVLNVGA